MTDNNQTHDPVEKRPLPELLSGDEQKKLLSHAEHLWSDLQDNNLGGFSGINRPFFILAEFRRVIEKFGHRDTGLDWSKDDLDALRTQAEQSSAQPASVDRNAVLEEALSTAAETLFWAARRMKGSHCRGSDIDAVNLAGDNARRALHTTESMSTESMVTQAAMEPVEAARRIYRALEMSAGIMRDPKRTGGWEGAERTADAFERQAKAAKDLHDTLRTAAQLEREAVLEEAARRIYESPWFGHGVAGTKTPWVSGGNSDMQHLARRFARAALSALTTPAPAEGDDLTDEQWNKVLANVPKPDGPLTPIAPAVSTDPLALAILFHNTYEQLAPQFGYETRPDTKQFDPNTPNGRLMTAVCAAILTRLGAEQ